MSLLGALETSRPCGTYLSRLQVETLLTPNPIYTISLRGKTIDFKLFQGDPMTHFLKQWKLEILWVILFWKYFCTNTRLQNISDRPIYFIAWQKTSQRYYFLIYFKSHDRISNYYTTSYTRQWQINSSLPVSAIFVINNRILPCVIIFSSLFRVCYCLVFAKFGWSIRNERFRFMTNVPFNER